MNVKEYLAIVADVVEGTYFHDKTKLNTYISKYDKSYITLVGLEDDVKYLAEMEITEQLSSNTGFSPLHNKWYGWSHRTIYGFTIGSTCVKGDCHYRPSNIDETLNELVRFWSDDDIKSSVKAEVTSPNEITVSWTYTDDVPNEELRSKISSMTIPFNTENFGRGEWTAETMEDAKQMAIDFANGVS